MRIAFVGLGMMGYPMAARLALRGFALAVFDLSTAAAERFAKEHGARKAASAADAARDADVAITMLPGSDEVSLALLGREGAGGMAEALRPGAVVIDMSSCDPLRTRELATKLDSRGLGFIDAPVSGGVKRAKDGSLAIMVGGGAALLETCRPVLEAMGTTISHTGPVGSGHAMKALNNFVSAAGLIAAVEALHVGRTFGLDPATMTRIFNSSTGRNNTTENKVGQFMLSGKFDSGFSLALMAKDLGIAMRLAEQVEVPAELGHACLSMWREADSRSGAGTDHTEMYRLLAPQNTKEES